MKFCEKLQELRKSRGLTREEFYGECRFAAKER